jgi:nucleoside-diphosphate-sugar epimerase
MRVAVTGAAGFIGSHLVEALVNKGFFVIAIDSLNDDLYPRSVKELNWNLLKTLNGSVECIQVDLRDPIDERIFHGCDAVFNLAAMPGLSLSWSNPKLYIDSNLLVTCNLMSAMEKIPGVKFIQISTSSVYGKSVLGDENSPLQPISPYGVSKLAAENAVIAIGNAKGILFSILRLFSVYGPRQRPDMAFNIFIKKMLVGESISVFGDGTQIRANTYVGDIVNGVILAYEKFESSSIYNLSGTQEYSVNQILDIAKGILNVEPRVEYVAERLGDQSRTTNVSERATRILGYKPETTIVEGLTRQINWQKAAFLPSGPQSA